MLFAENLKSNQHLKDYGSLGKHLDRGGCLNFTEHEIRKKYRYSNLSYVFDVYMECEFRANITPNKYEGLKPGEFRFDYKSWEDRLGYSHKQMVRAIKELTSESIVIIQIEKGKKGVSSKYYLARFQEQKKEQNREQKQEQKESNNINELQGIEEQNGEQKQEQKTIHSSQYNNLNIISNNIYSHWNSKKIIVHKSLTKDIGKAIENALKKYSESEIVQAINTYSEILESNFYFNYKWSLVDFLNRKNGISTFMEDGSNKANYEVWEKECENNNANTRRVAKRDRGVFNKDSENIKIELPEREFRHYTNEELESLGID